MTLSGSRKIILAGAFGATIMAVPTITDNQVQLMSVLIYSVFGANGLEHVAKGVSDAVRSRAGARAAGTVRPVTDPKQSIERGAH